MSHSAALSRLRMLPVCVCIWVCMCTYVYVRMCACVCLFVPIYQCICSFGHRKQWNRPCGVEIVRNCLLPSPALCLSLSLCRPLSPMFSTFSSILCFYFSISAASHVCPFFFWTLICCFVFVDFILFSALDLCICSLCSLSVPKGKQSNFWRYPRPVNRKRYPSPAANPLTPLAVACQLASSTLPSG